MLVGEAPVMTGPGDEMAAGTAGRGRLRASHADREQVIGTLKAVFVGSSSWPTGGRDERPPVRLLP